VTAVILVGDSIVTPVAGTVPMLTVVPAAKLVPTIVIAVPPNVLPDGGVMEEIPTADGAAGPLHEREIASPRTPSNPVNTARRTWKLYRALTAQSAGRSGDPQRNVAKIQLSYSCAVPRTDGLFLRIRRRVWRGELW
jgi:hypothetical protein